MEERTKIKYIAALTVILLLVLIDPRMRSSIVTYVLVVIIVIMGLTLKTQSSTQIEYSSSNYAKKRKLEKAFSGGKLDNKDKKLLMFHILTVLDKKETIDMSELAADFEIGIYELNDVVRFLSKHELVTIMYPPMHNFPIIRRGDSAKSLKFRAGIFHSTSKTATKDPKMEEFAREVQQYLETKKRK